MEERLSLIEERLSLIQVISKSISEHSPNTDKPETNKQTGGTLCSGRGLGLRTCVLVGFVCLFLVGFFKLLLL